jgi:glycolate oxidase FAD binding subunit
VRDVAAQAGGHATLFRGRDRRAGAFHPLNAVQTRLQSALADAFDPDRVFDRARLFSTAA